MQTTTKSNDRQSFEKSADNDSFPEDIRTTDQWVLADTSGQKKVPVAPWNKTGPVNAHDSQYWTDFDTARDHAEGDGYELGFDFTEDDPFVLLDFDNARDPETGHIDPAVAELVERAESYADISISGTGVHLVVQGELPEDTKQISGPIGENDAKIEVFECSQFGVMTGQHVADTPTQCHRRQELLDELVDEYRTIPASTPENAIAEPTRSREEVEQISETGDLDAIWDAVKQTRPSDVRWDSPVTETRSDGTKSRDPSWTQSASGTRIGEFEDGFVYRDGMISLDVLKMVALEERIIDDPGVYPQGEDYFEAIDALRERGAPIPEYQSPQNTEFQLPAVSDVLDISLSDQRKRARTEGYNWPSTDELYDRLEARIFAQMRRAESSIIPAPTAAGKTHAIATTPWANYPDLTGEEPVVHLLKTTDARDEAYQMGDEDRITSEKLLGNEDACPVAQGKYNRDNNLGNESLDHLIPEANSVSEWIKTQTEEKKISFGRVHGWLEQKYKREHGGSLPCCRGEQTCRSRSQWENISLDDRNSDSEEIDVIHATHGFAYVQGLVSDATVVFDEQPEFDLDIEKARLHEIIKSFVSEIDAPQTTWADFIGIVRNGSESEKQKLEEALNSEPRSDWYFESANAHAYAPAIVRAIVSSKPAGNKRYTGTAECQTFYKRDKSGETEASVVIRVVITEKHKIDTIQAIPPLQEARCVIGLDAYPCEERWRLNTLAEMSVHNILTAEERRLWRLLERGLLVVQVGDADRPLTRSEYFNETKTEALIEEIDSRLPNLQTAITSQAVEEHVEQMLPKSSLENQVLHYNEEESRNDFQGEQSGLIVGCIDPGDGPVLDWLALLDGDAEPERADAACDECGGQGCFDCLDTGKKRAHGRGFNGPDADIATDLLGSVREMHVAQSIGRYARKATRPEEPTVVIAWTAAIPDELVDVKIPDVRSLTETQREIVAYVENADGGVSTREIKDELEITKEMVRQTLKKLVEIDCVTVDKTGNKNGAYLYTLQQEVEGFLQMSE